MWMFIDTSDFCVRTSREVLTKIEFLTRGSNCREFVFIMFFVFIAKIFFIALALSEPPENRVDIEVLTVRF